MILTLSLILALLIGSTLGLLGGGGSVLSVPVFVYVLGLDPKIAIVTSLAVVAVISMAGSVSHLRGGTCDVRVALIFAIGSAVGAMAGSAVAVLISGDVQLILFSLVLFVSSLLMLRGKRPAATPTSHTQPGTFALHTLWRLVPTALGVGMLTGLLGVGGGFLIVPSLVLIFGIEMRRASGTSLFVIAINATVAFIGYMRQQAIRDQLATTTIAGFDLVLFLILFTAMAVVGVVAGVLIARRLHPKHLRRGFALLLIVVAVGMLVKSVMGQ